MSSYDSRIDTWEHIHKVQGYLIRAVENLIERAHVHDASKLVEPELSVFNEYTLKLAEMEYGSDEYKAALEGMGEALEHHYAHNPHHPEHHAFGIDGMSLFDLIEMLCDWQAASERMRKPMPAAPGRAEAPKYDSNMARSIALNAERFGYGQAVQMILTNTAREMGLLDEQTQKGG